MNLLDSEQDENSAMIEMESPTRGSNFLTRYT